MKRTKIQVVRVFRSPLDHRRGRLVAGAVSIPCALGRAGTIRGKREGDGATPIGSFPLLGGYFRADHLSRPQSGVPLRRLRPMDGWCDDPADRRYNRPISLPDRARHERLWRDDGLYDIVLDMAANRRPIHRGRGSAIFFHVARPGLLPTEGCVAIPRREMEKLLPRLGPCTRIVVA